MKAVGQRDKHCSFTKMVTSLNGLNLPDEVNAALTKLTTTAKQWITTLAWKGALLRESPQPGSSAGISRELNNQTWEAGI